MNKIYKMSDQELIDWLENNEKVDDEGINREEILNELLKRAGDRSVAKRLNKSK